MKGILLDIDGTLIDSNDAHARAWAKTLEEARLPSDYGVIRSKIGEGGDRLLPQVTGISAESEQGKELTERRGQIFRREFLPKISAFPHARELLLLFRDRGLRFAAATSGGRTDAQALLTQAGLGDILTELVTADDAEATKPDPSILEAALRKLKLSPGEALMIGDTPYDMEAARRAGVSAIAFTCGGWSREALNGAAEIYSGPAELLANAGRSLINSY
jgi:HAD superfamily hydrolase (TIGR01509 family)